MRIHVGVSKFPMVFPGYYGVDLFMGMGLFMGMDLVMEMGLDRGPCDIHAVDFQWGKGNSSVLGHSGYVDQ